MRNLSDKEKKTFVYRTIAVIGFVLMTATRVFSIYKIFVLHDSILFQDATSIRKIWEGSNLLLNFVCWAVFLYLIFRPLKIIYFADISFLYAFSILIDSPGSFMGPLMYILGMTALYSRGFFIRHTKRKFALFILAYFLLTLTQLRFGINVFLDSLLATIGHTLIIALAFVLLNNRQTEILQIAGKKAVNLLEVPSLTERERVILKKVLEGKKYDAIASEENLSPAYLRNMMKGILKKVSAGSQIELLKNYGGYPVIATQEELDEWNGEIARNIPPHIQLDTFIHIKLPYIPTPEELLAEEMEDAEFL